MNTSLKKESWPYTLVLFFLLPFALFIVALKKSNYSWAKNVVWAYIIFFGFTFVIYGTGSDSYQYWLDLKRMYDNNISFKELVSGFYYSSQNIDIFSSLLMFVVSKFTDSPKVLFAVFGFFFGFFL